MTKNDESKPQIEVVRGNGKKKREEFAYCKWATGAWEAEFYANTPTHKRSRERTLRVMMNDPCWYSTLKTLKTDTRRLQRRTEGKRKSVEKQENDE